MTRTRPQTDRIAWPWLIRRFIDSRAPAHRRCIGTSTMGT
ncbi:chromate resistance protein ChrB domain-containing protein [Nonomuraea ceibae]